MQQKENEKQQALLLKETIQSMNKQNKILQDQLLSYVKNQKPPVPPVINPTQPTQQSKQISRVQPQNLQQTTANPSVDFQQTNQLPSPFQSQTGQF